MGLRFESCKINVPSCSKVSWMVRLGNTFLTVACLALGEDGRLRFPHSTLNHRRETLGGTPRFTTCKLKHRRSFALKHLGFGFPAVSVQLEGKQVELEVLKAD
jgi:hypothetical protein